MRRVWMFYVAVLTAGLPVYFLAMHGTVQRWTFYAYGLSSVAAIVVGIRAHRPERRLPWLAFAAGLLLFVLGDIAFDLYAHSGGNIPIPSVADVLYMAGYPVLALALVRLVRSRVASGQLASTLDGLMVAMGVGVVAWVFVMAPYAHDRTLSLAAQVVAIAYPALDLLLLAVLTRLLLGVRARNRSYGMLAASVVALLVADGFYAVASLHGTYRDGSLIDLGWLASYMLWGAAALHPSMSKVTDPPPSTEMGRSRASMVVLTMAALAAPTVLIVQDVRGRQVDVTLMAAASVVMFGLVLARLGILTRALHNSYRRVGRAEARQRVLTEAAVAFVGAGDADTVTRAAVQAAVDLAGGAESWASFVTMTPAGLTVAAAAGSAVSTAGQLADADLADFFDKQALAGEPAPLSAGAEDGHLGARGGAARFAAPVQVNGQLRGVLGVGAIASGSGEVLASLGLLGSQMGLALQTAEATEERMRARNERLFSSLVEHSADVVTLVGADGVVRYHSPGVKAMFGRHPDELVGKQLGELIHPDDLSEAQAVFAQVFAGELGASANLECRMAHSDGSWRVVDIVTTNLIDDPDVGAVVLNKRDVTERRSLEQELNHQAFHDTLTGLANRALFLDRVDHALSLADREAAHVAVLFFDLDDFKTVNDSLGHPAGDQLLVEVAKRLNTVVRPGDTVARLGGDEFAVLLESGEMPAVAQTVATRLAEALEEPFWIGGDEVTIQASVGIALGQPRQHGANELLRDADLAMYMAKHNGKGRFELFEPAMHEHAVHRLQIAADLRRGMASGQLEVFYQPIVNAATATACGAEALVRWHHPTRGLVSPVEFVPVAESTGLIVPLGKWVLAEACRQAQTWRLAGLFGADFYISVNLSARQLQDPRLIDDVAEVLKDSGLPPRSLVLEVTESTVMENFDTALARLGALKDLGLRLAVDDFGTGHSSLSQLRNLPVDVVKIDKSFIDRITLDAAGAAMVRSVIELGHALGLTSIAEGVEEPDQLALLDHLGCDHIQGYLYAKPMPGSEIPRALAGLQDDAASLPSGPTIGPVATFAPTR
jgi:diguanylate cyclase (GGDEF)-like protein/PAS domain S-box-containing protein